MATVSPTLASRWRQQSSYWAREPGDGVGRPQMRVEVRSGRFNRRYDDWNGEPLGVRIAGTGGGQPWQAFWEELTPYVEIPGVASVRLEQDFQNNGITVATVEIDNVLYRETGAGNTLMHTVERGALAPFRGYAPPNRPGWDPALQNEWYDKLARNAQITIHQGYDGEEVKTFTGLIDDVDLTSDPDRITITCRDFGQLLTDQRMFGHVKNPYIRDPVTFVDRLTADAVKLVGYGAAASDEDTGGNYPPSHVTDLDADTYWRSRIYGAANATTWVQIRIPQGRYASFWLNPKWPGHEVYVSLYAKERTDGKPCRWNGQDIGVGWVENGLGNVPGANGGIPYVRKIDSASEVPAYYDFGPALPELECGPGSILRIHFRNLAPVEGDIEQIAGYRAGVQRLAARKRELSSEAKEKRWVLVDDAADVVRVILRWAGFKEWDVEGTGVRLKRPVVFNRGDFLIDCIRKMAEAVNYVFFINDPTSDDLSLGVPVFRKSRVLTEDAPVAAVRDRDLLTGIRVKMTDEPLAYVIRVRGRLATDEETGAGYLIGGGSQRRVKFTYYPPWARLENRLAGILKHVVHHDNKLTSTEDCEFACYYIALQEALEAITGSIEIPATPVVELDSFVAVEDLGTGIFSRLWVASRSSEFTNGETRAWTQSVGGTWVDTPDVIAMKDIINAAVLARGQSA